MSDNDDFQDPRAALYGPRDVAPAGPRSTQSKDNDVNRTVTATINHDGSISHKSSGFLRGNSETAGMGVDRGGVFAQMRSRSGTPISVHQLTDDSVVQMAGMTATMSLKSAIQAGYVVRHSDGTYSVPGGSSQRQEKKDTNPDLTDEVFTNKQSEDAFRQLLQETQPGAQIAAVNDVVKMGEISERAMIDLAVSAGIEPSQMAERVAPVIAAFQAQADNVISDHGVDPQAVYDWARENKNSALQDAMRKLGMMRQTGGFAALAKDYVSTLDKHDPDAILNAQFGDGVKVSKVQGKIIVETKDGQFTWASAIRAGIVKVGKRR